MKTDAPAKDLKPHIAKKIADITAHETLDMGRKSHAIATLKKLQLALADPDTDVDSFIADTLAQIDERLSVIAAEERRITQENEARAKRQPPEPPIPFPRRDVTLAQRFYTEHALKTTVAALAIKE